MRAAAVAVVKLLPHEPATINAMKCTVGVCPDNLRSMAQEANKVAAQDHPNCPYQIPNLPAR